MTLPLPLDVVPSDVVPSEREDVFDKGSYLAVALALHLLLSRT